MFSIETKWTQRMFQFPWINTSTWFNSPSLFSQLKLIIYFYLSIHLFFMTLLLYTVCFEYHQLECVNVVVSSGSRCLIWRETVLTCTTVCGGGGRPQRRPGATWPQLASNMWWKTLRPTCLTRSGYRPETTLERVLNPTWWWDSLEKTVSGRQKISSAWRSHQLVSCQLHEALVAASHALRDSSCSEPTDAPTDLRVSKVHSTSVHVYWKPVDLKSVRGEFKEYRVSFQWCFWRASQLVEAPDGFLWRCHRDFGEEKGNLPTTRTKLFCEPNSTSWETLI